MVDYRVPRAYARRHVAYQEIMEGQRPTLKYLKASPYLPVAEIEPLHNDPIVLPAGTFVGILSLSGTTFGTGSIQTGTPTGTATYSLDNSLGYYAMFPAASREYTLTYNASDIDTTFYTPGTLNIDALGAVIGAAGASTRKIGIGAGTGLGVKPLGIVYQDIYASWLASNYTNYDRQPNVGFLSSNQVIQVPAITIAEMAIEPGDIVMVDGFDQASLTWNPSTLFSNTTVIANSPGRLRKYSDVVTIAGNPQYIDAARCTEHVVGRCLRKFLVASKVGTTMGTKLSYALTQGTITSLSNIHAESKQAGRVQTVPGLNLPGSGSLGVGGHLLHAKADQNGNFWALEIMVGTY